MWTCLSADNKIRASAGWHESHRTINRLATEMAATIQYAIDVDQITKRFGEFTAVDRISFKVEHGEIFGLLGPNGAGKSTLIRMMTTLIPPTTGTARVGGFDVVRSPDSVRKCIGVNPLRITSDLELSGEETME